MYIITNSIVTIKMNEYTRSLRQRITNNVDTDKKNVISEPFSAWDAHIAENLITREPSGGEIYSEGADAKLLVACKEHALKYQRPKQGKNTILLVHPFYLHLSDIAELSEPRFIREAETYLNLLLRLLHIRKNNPEVYIAVLETIHHYATATSLLMEQGLIDRTLFTWYDKGRLLDEGEFNLFSNDHVFCGGGYTEACLSSSIRDAGNWAKDVRLIKGLALNSPYDYPPRLLASGIDELPKSRVITLEKLIKRLGLENKY